MSKLLVFVSLFTLTSTLPAQITWSDYAANRTLTAPTAEALAQQLTAGLTDPTEKAAAIYDWITHNIAYDVKLYEEVVSGRWKRRSYTPAELQEVWDDRIRNTLKKRRGVCDNYARLYQRMAESVGLNCAYVTGYAKPNGLRANTLGQTHAWNAVEIDGEWKLVDATWGAGSLKMDGKFHQDFRPGYFFSRPESLRYSHFPKDPEWQLLPDKITEAEFKLRPGVGAEFIRYGLGDLTENRYEISVPRGEDFVYRFTTAREIEGLVCANMTTRRQIDCAVERTAEGYAITVPEVKNMVFSLFVGAEDMLVSYRLRVR